MIQRYDTKAPKPVNKIIAAATDELFSPRSGAHGIEAYSIALLRRCITRSPRDLIAQKNKTLKELNFEPSAKTFHDA